jgi:caffeoyl-CoA O-methyltransferase
LADDFMYSYSEQVDRYLTSVLPARDAVLTAMETHAIEAGFPHIGPLVGPFLQMLARAIGAKRIFEMGSGFGFSAVHFARAIPVDGRIVCTDGDADNARVAREYFAKAGVESQIEFRVGDAVSILAEYPGPFDIILMDIDKEGYPDGFRAAWPKVRPGGLFIADNMLWHGEVMIDSTKPTTLAIRELTRLLYAMPDALTTIVPLRDGVAVAMKVGR